MTRSHHLRSLRPGVLAAMNLNVPPDTRGRVRESDVESLRQFGEHLRLTFAENLALGAKFKASNTRSGDSAYGNTWKTVSEGEFGNLRANPIEQTVSFATTVKARYFKFTANHALQRNHAVVAEIGVVE